MRRHLLDLVILLGLSTIACAYLAIAQPGVRNVALYSYVLIAGALIMLAVVSSFGDAFPRHRRSPFDDALVAPLRSDRTPAQVEQIERAVTLGVATAYDLHARLLPHLREIAQCRLERTGRTPSPETLGRWWELLRPDRVEPVDRFAVGLPEGELLDLVADLERM